MPGCPDVMGNALLVDGWLFQCSSQRIELVFLVGLNFTLRESRGQPIDIARRHTIVPFAISNLGLRELDFGAKFRIAGKLRDDWNVNLLQES